MASTDLGPLAVTVSGLVIRSHGGRALVTIPELRIAPGGLTVIRGPSGAGKSTLLFALAGLLIPDNGHVNWGETDLTLLSDRQRAALRRKHLGLMFQDHLLFEELSGLQNAALAAAYAPRAERAGLRAAARSYCQDLGIGKAAGRPARSLSGGERQRFALARALCADPEIVLADEPTASLDRANADQMIEILCRLCRDRQKTLVVVSHDSALHRRAGRVIDMADGRIVAPPKAMSA